MSPSEIVLIVSCVLFVVGVIIGSVVKKRKNKKNGSVACCDCGGSCGGHCQSCHGCVRTAEDVKKFIEKQ